MNNWIASNYIRCLYGYVVCLKALGTFLGACGLYWDPESRRILQIGYVLKREVWDCGDLPEAEHRLIQFGWTAPGAQRISAPVFVENTRSRRAAGKMGMTCEGVARSSMEAHGCRWDQAIYSTFPGNDDA